MKHKITLLLCAALVSVQVYAQKVSADKVPAAVADAFKAKYPKVDKPVWEMEKDKSYEASFKQDDKKHSALFHERGAWIESETEIKTSDLPQAITTAVSNQFAGFEIAEADQVESATQGNCYEVEVKKGKEIIELRLTAEGALLSKANGELHDKDDDNDEK